MSIADTMDFLLYLEDEYGKGNVEIRLLNHNDMNKYDQVQDVVDAIERELFIEVPKGYGVEVITTRSKLPLTMCWTTAIWMRLRMSLSTMPQAHETSALTKEARPFVSSLTIRF